MDNSIDKIEIEKIVGKPLISYNSVNPDKIVNIKRDNSDFKASYNDQKKVPNTIRRMLEPSEQVF